jgi:hypothetical protein
LNRKEDLGHAFHGVWFASAFFFTLRAVLIAAAAWGVATRNDNSRRGAWGRFSMIQSAADNQKGWLHLRVMINKHAE